MNDDPRFTLEAIRPLVSHQDPTARQVTFTCPMSRRQVTARSGLGAEVMSRAADVARIEIRRQLHSLLRSVLGGGSLARSASSLVDTALDATWPAARPLDGPARDQLLLAAFRTVSHHFAWSSGRWVHREAVPRPEPTLSPLDRQLRDHPLTSAYDRLVGARIATEISLAHGGISEAERSELEALLDPSVGSLEALRSRPPLSKAELDEVSPGSTRITLLALGWVIALCDESLAGGEEDRLTRIADGLRISPQDRLRARDLARTWVLDQWLERAFSWGGHDTHLREQAIAVGERIGMSREEVEAAEARFQKQRLG